MYADVQAYVRNCPECIVVTAGGRTSRPTLPFCGVPEALLSDRGTNLFCSLMLDICDLLGTKKLNTTRNVMGWLSVLIVP